MIIRKATCCIFRTKFWNCNFSLTGTTEFQFCWNGLNWQSWNSVIPDSLNWQSLLNRPQVTFYAQCGWNRNVHFSTNICHFSTMSCYFSINIFHFANSTLHFSTMSCHFSINICHFANPTLHFSTNICHFSTNICHFANPTLQFLTNICHFSTTRCQCSTTRRNIGMPSAVMSSGDNILHASAWNPRTFNKQIFSISYWIASLRSCW